MPAASIAATPLVAAVLRLKFGVVKPSAASAKVTVPKVAVSSLVVAETSPPKVPASSIGLTVILIVWVSTLPSSSVTWTTKLSAPL